MKAARPAERPPLLKADGPAMTDILNPAVLVFVRQDALTK